MLRDFVPLLHIPQYFAQTGDGTGSDVVGQHAVGFKQINGKWFYFAKDGDGTGSAIGQMVVGTHKLNGQTYYFNEYDKKQNYYFRDASGDAKYMVKGEMATGRIFHDNTTSWYYAMAGDGTGLPEGAQFHGDVKVNGIMCHFE
ncbi:hypothetical protein BK708_24910 [Bacillus thuringiensis serovar yunnanensis]|nr:hypothetical protein BK708_24910 [Bacillus thuringiensis serovar yunnanensis]